jgi:hypothetical protein
MQLTHKSETSCEFFINPELAGQVRKHGSRARENTGSNPQKGISSFSFFFPTITNSLQTCALRFLLKQKKYRYV